MVRDREAERINKAHWDEVAPVHGNSYDIQTLLDGGHHLDPVQVEELGDLKGKRVLHLQCHIGTDTLSLARLGAEVTGVDISGESLAVARNLAERTGLSARFIETPIFDLPDALQEQGTFDMVYTSIGVLCWISDLDLWADIISSYLKPGGVLYLMESHPFMHVFDDEQTGLSVRYSYFMEGQPVNWPGNWPDYSDENYIVKNPTREFQWSVSEIISSLLNSNLALKHFHEFDFLHWKGLESMRRCDDGYWRLPKSLNKIPVLFSLMAVKQG